MKRFLLFIALTALLVLMAFTLWFYWRNPLTAKVKINDQLFYVELAVTPKEKEIGLSGRQTLASKHGMLFNYDHKDTYPFWMKGVRFPLDFVWIEDLTVVDLTRNARIQTTEPFTVYKPKVPVSKILELNAGEIDKYRLKIGDKVKFIN